MTKDTTNTNNANNVKSFLTLIMDDYCLIKKEHLSIIPEGCDIFKNEDTVGKDHKLLLMPLNSSMLIDAVQF